MRQCRLRGAKSNGAEVSLCLPPKQLFSGIRREPTAWRERAVNNSFRPTDAVDSNVVRPLVVNRSELLAERFNLDRSESGHLHVVDFLQDIDENNPCTKALVTGSLGSGPTITARGAVLKKYPT